MDGRKIVVLLGDGMADRPISELQNQTVLQAVDTPNMDQIARKGVCGLAQTIPEGLAPGSDVANLSVMGYNPQKYYTGRAPLEALNLGIELGPNDVAFRCNFVKIKDGIMADFSADHLESEFGKIIINELNKQLANEVFEFYPGVSYRNILVWKNYPYQKVTETTPPHDISDKNIEGHFPKNDGQVELNEIMLKAQQVIATSSEIKDALTQYQGDLTDIWLWGGGQKPTVKSFDELFGIDGATISAVDLIHGIGKAAGLDSLIVNGATGYIDTNYAGKVEALTRGLNKYDFIYLHVEAPDESGHEGSLEHKSQAIKDFDSKVVGPVLKFMDANCEDYSILVMPDHPTPIEIKTHSSDPIPFAILHKDNNNGKYAGAGFDEVSAKKTGLFVDDASTLLSKIIRKEI